MMESKDWDIRREPCQWTKEEWDRRLYQALEKIEFAGGIFDNDRERMTVLAMLLENLGMHKAVQLGNPADRKAAVDDLLQSTQGK